MKDKITQERLKELLNYNADTGVFTWKVYRAANARVGDIAGSLNKISGYVMIYVDYKNYYAHILAYLYVEGVYPPNMLDHANRIKSDNSWSNIRLSCMAENMANKPIQPNNRLGIKGICFINDSSPRYRARVISDGKVYMKSFSIKLHKEHAINKAIEWVEAKRELLHKEFSCHG